MWMSGARRMLVALEPAKCRATQQENSQGNHRQQQLIHVAPCAFLAAVACVGKGDQHGESEDRDDDEQEIGHTVLLCAEDVKTCPATGQTPRLPAPEHAPPAAAAHQ